MISWSLHECTRVLSGPGLSGCKSLAASGPKIAYVRLAAACRLLTWRRAECRAPAWLGAFQSCCVARRPAFDARDAMLFTAKDYRHLIGLRGFSELLLDQHFNLYEGYVKNASELLERITSLRSEAKPPTIEMSELSRRFAWEFNGMRLHELYFDGLTHEPPPLDMSSSLVEGLAHSFSSLEAWRQDFRAVGAMRGIGWVVLCVDRLSGPLANPWCTERDTGW